ncbi:hypothetical protein PAXRUDRAFT_177271, partial [Paxillus rubicundulus Ve08.2h10]
SMWEFPAMWQFPAINVAPSGISHSSLLACVGIPSHVCRSQWDFLLYAVDLNGNSQPCTYISPLILLIYMEIPCHVR